MEQRHYPFLGYLGVLLSAGVIVGTVYVEPRWGWLADAGLFIGGLIAVLALLVVVQIGLAVRTSLEPVLEPRRR